VENPNLKPNPKPGPADRYELVTREGCHLCDEMARVLDAVLPRFGLAYAAVDVDADPALRERWSDAVPVLLREGAPVAKVRITERDLERIVRRRR
jgi:hypothetical protein